MGPAPQSRAGLLQLRPPLLRLQPRHCPSPGLHRPGWSYPAPAAVPSVPAAGSVTAAAASATVPAPASAPATAPVPAESQFVLAETQRTRARRAESRATNVFERSSCVLP